VPDNALAQALAMQAGRVSEAGIASVVSIGDCWAPGTIAAAVYAGHRHGREFDRPLGKDVEFERELPSI
jgi:dimethylamine/trimethylamine dehydrogenase